MRRPPCDALIAPARGRLVRRGVRAKLIRQPGPCARLMRRPPCDALIAPARGRLVRRGVRAKLIRQREAA